MSLGKFGPRFIYINMGYLDNPYMWKKRVVMIDQKYINVSCFDSPYTWKNEVVMITQKHEKIKKVVMVTYVHVNMTCYGIPLVRKKQWLFWQPKRCIKWAIRKPCLWGLLWQPLCASMWVAMTAMNTCICKWWWQLWICMNMGCYDQKKTSVRYRY
jgi:hypothetical protein